MKCPHEVAPSKRPSSLQRLNVTTQMSCCSAVNKQLLLLLLILALLLLWKFQLNVNKQIQSAIREPSWTTDYKPLVTWKKVIIFSAASLILTVCMDVILITVPHTRMTRKICSFNETIIYCKASNRNKCMAVPVCVCVCDREGEVGKGVRQTVIVRRQICL